MAKIVCQIMSKPINSNKGGIMPVSKIYQISNPSNHISLVGLQRMYKTMLKQGKIQKNGAAHKRLQFLMLCDDDFVLRKVKENEFNEKWKDYTPDLEEII